MTGPRAAQTTSLPESLGDEFPLSREMIDCVLTSIPDAVVVTDAAGLVTYWNGGAERLFGWESRERIGVGWTLRLPPDVRDEADR